MYTELKADGTIIQVVEDDNHVENEANTNTTSPFTFLAEEIRSVLSSDGVDTLDKTKTAIIEAIDKAVELTTTE